MQMRTSNPALRAGTFDQSFSLDSSERMTIDGTIYKTGLLTLILLASATWVWRMFYGGNSPEQMSGLLVGGVIGGLIFALVTMFKKEWARVTAPLYCVCEGVVLGAISALMEFRYPGIVIQAVCLTFAVLFSLLLAYRFRLVRATENFKLGIFAATSGIALVYLASIVLGFFHIRMPFIHESGMIGIGFSLFVVVIAALNLVLDFDFIEQGAERGAPKYMEWYAAFGLMVTLVWLYLEILKLLSKLNDRRR